MFSPVCCSDGIEWHRVTARISTIATFPIIHHYSDLTAAIIDTRTAIINHRRPACNTNIYYFYFEKIFTVVVFNKKYKLGIK